jgi:hypothetical protein
MTEMASMMTTRSSKIELELLLSPASTWETTATATEELRKYVVHIHSSRITTSCLLSEALLSKLVISFSFFRITQGFISICNLLKFLFCFFRVSLIFIRMIFNS